jgi:hypothetical protein
MVAYLQDDDRDEGTDIVHDWEAGEEFEFVARIANPC